MWWCGCGISAITLMSLFQFVVGFQWLVLIWVFVTGILVGIEIPILMRLLKDVLRFEDIVSRVLSFDYAGALLASIIFPLICLPYLGLTKTAIFFGMLNVVAGLITTLVFRKAVHNFKACLFIGILSMLTLICLFVFADKISTLTEAQQFPGKIIHAESSSYQRIVVTRNAQDYRLFLNGNLQFSSDDEYRYHEALVHPAMLGSKEISSVLILGGGDGLALREVLKYSSVKQVTLVDLDEKITHLFSSHGALKNINQGSLLNSKLKLVHADAFTWLRNTTNKYDCAIIDFPDPSNYAIAKLYTNTFYSLLQNHLNDSAWCVVQCTSPFAARNSFWTIDATIRSTGFNSIPYYNVVPSFGFWGYILASKQSNYKAYRNVPNNLKYFETDNFYLMRQFPKDMLATKEVGVNKLNNQVLVAIFEEEWSKYLQ